MRSLAVIIVCAGCAGSAPPDPGLEGLALASVQPGVVVPGTTLVITGDSFVDAPWGATTLYQPSVW